MPSLTLNHITSMLGTYVEPNGDFKASLNQVMARLHNIGTYRDLTVQYSLPVVDGCITLPDDADSVLHTMVDGHPAPVRSMWHDFKSVGSTGADLTWGLIDSGFSPTMRLLPDSGITQLFVVPFGPYADSRVFDSDDGEEIVVRASGSGGISEGKPEVDYYLSPVIERPFEEGAPNIPQTLAMVISETTSPNYNGLVPLIGIYNGRECFSTDPDALADPSLQPDGIYATAIYYDGVKWVVKHTEYKAEAPYPPPTIIFEEQINGLYVTGGPETVTAWFGGNPTLTRSLDNPPQGEYVGQQLRWEQITAGTYRTYVWNGSEWEELISPNPEVIRPFNLGDPNLIPMSMIVTGELTDGTAEIPVPVIIPLALVGLDGFPAYDDPGFAEINPINPSGFELIAGSGGWFSTSDVTLPSLADWSDSATAPATGTPIVTAGPIFQGAFIGQQLRWEQSVAGTFRSYVWNGSAWDELTTSTVPNDGPTQILIDFPQTITNTQSIRYEGLVISYALLTDRDDINSAVAVVGPDSGVTRYRRFRLNRATDGVTVVHVLCKRAFRPLIHGDDIAHIGNIGAIKHGLLARIAEDNADIERSEYHWQRCSLLLEEEANSTKGAALPRLNVDPFGTGMQNRIYQSY